MRERHLRLLRAQWRSLLGFGGAVVAFFAAAACFVDHAFTRGLLVGSGVVSGLACVAAITVLCSGTAPLIMGELAEQWTAQELRPARQQGWRLANHFGLGPGDHDHVLVGPGGVVLVESKWGGTPWELTGHDHGLDAAVEQASRNARQLSLWSPVRRHVPRGVHAVLAIWGPAARELRARPPQRHTSGVVVLSGDQVRGWLSRRSGDVLDEAQVEAVWAEVTKHAGRRDAHEHSSRPMPRSPADVVRSVLLGLLAAVLGFIGDAQLLEHTESLLAWAGVGAGLLVAASAVARRGLRWSARSFQVGLLALYLLTIGDSIRRLLEHGTAPTGS